MWAMAEGLILFYADDDLDDLDMFREVVNELGQEIRLYTHNHGEMLLSALRTSPSPQIIFLDLNMPGKDGFDVLAELKGSPDLKDIPVVIFSTSIDERNISRSYRLGANYYLPKSTTFAGFKKSLQHTLGINWNTFTPTSANFVYR